MKRILFLLGNWFRITNKIEDFAEDQKITSLTNFEFRKKFPEIFKKGEFIISLNDKKLFKIFCTKNKNFPFILADFILKDKKILILEIANFKINPNLFTVIFKNISQIPIFIIDSKNLLENKSLLSLVNNLNDSSYFMYLIIRSRNNLEIKHEHCNILLDCRRKVNIRYFCNLIYKNWGEGRNREIRIPILPVLNKEKNNYKEINIALEKFERFESLFIKMIKLYKIFPELFLEINSNDNNNILFDKVKKFMKNIANIKQNYIAKNFLWLTSITKKDENWVVDNNGSKAVLSQEIIQSIGSNINIREINYKLPRMIISEIG